MVPVNFLAWMFCDERSVQDSSRVLVAMDSIRNVESRVIIDIILVVTCEPLDDSISNQYNGVGGRVSCIDVSCCWRSLYPSPRCGTKTNYLYLGNYNWYVAQSGIKPLTEYFVRFEPNDIAILTSTNTTTSAAATTAATTAAFAATSAAATTATTTCYRYMLYANISVCASALCRGRINPLPHRLLLFAKFPDVFLLFWTLWLCSVMFITCKYRAWTKSI